jgi:peptide/nickel transport system permease protein
MIPFLVRRLGFMLVVMWIVSMAVFVLSEVIPIDVARNILGRFATQEAVDAYRERIGLNCPGSVRYVTWLLGDEWIPPARAAVGEGMLPAGCTPPELHRYGLIRGDLGVSTTSGTPVAPLVMRRLRNSGILAGFAFILIMPISLLLGILAGVKEGKLLDRLITVLGLVSTSTPTFASGVYVILVLALWLRLLPGSSVFMTEDSALENPSMLIMPILVLFFAEAGYVARMMRASLVMELRAPYVRTAILKGMPPRRVIFHHALRNALLAPITVIITHINWLIGGLVVVESVFAYPGLGRLMLDAALNKNVNVVEACALVSTFFAVGTQIVADITYVYLNPRIRIS